MTEPTNKKLWELIKNDIEKRTNKRWNAYYSGLLVKEYKSKGGTFKGEKPKDINKRPLERWFKEEWQSIGGNYPTYRPTKKITSKTPLTANEISTAIKKKQIKLKQQIKDKSNLPKF